MRRPSRVLVAVISVAVVGFAAPSAEAAPVGATDWMSRTWGVDGRVTELVPTSRGVIVGGSFSTGVAPSGATRGLSSVGLWSPESGRFLDWPVSVTGEVDAATVSGDTVYLGGDFTRVNGANRRNLAAVSLTTGDLLDWGPEAFGAVETLAVSGGDVYVGGAFSDIRDDQAMSPASYLARISPAGRLDRTWTGSIQLDDRVRDIEPSPDGTIYIGGDFTQVDGTSRYGRTAKIGTGTTAALDTGFRSGNNNGNSRSPVFDLLLSGSDLLIASGGGGGGCARQDATTGVTAWTHHGNGDMQAVAVLGPYVYCGGHFGGTKSFDGLDRYKLAEVVRTTGAITGWNPRVNSALGLWAMTSTDTALVAGGDFTKVRQSRQPHLGEFRDLSALTGPSAPVGVTARPGDNKVTLQWGAPDFDGGANVSRYLVLRENDQGDLVQVGNTNLTSFDDTSVTNGHTYRYAIQARTSVADGVPSATVSATPDANAVFPPTVPRNFTGTGGSFAQLGWDAPTSDGGAPISAYRLYRAVGSGSESLLQTVAGSARGAQDTTCPLAETCRYRLAAVNAAGEGPKTQQVSLVANTGRPSAPVLSGSPGPGVAVTLGWTLASSGAAPVKRFVLLRDGVRLTKVGGSTYSYVDSAVVSGRSYTYQVRAVNDYGNSDNSDPVTVRAP